jgi:hypothetical protein
MTYKHIKSGDFYEIINADIIGAGELCRGKVFTLYTKNGSVYIREQDDFNMKFKELRDD